MSPFLLPLLKANAEHGGAAAAVPRGAAERNGATGVQVLQQRMLQALFLTLKFK